MNFNIFLAGYNHLDVVEYLLENKANVNAKDKGGLVPLHNAASYGVSLSFFNIILSLSLFLSPLFPSMLMLQHY